MRDKATVRVEAMREAKLAFGGLMGYDKWPIRTAASASVGYMSYEVGLVLDTTGSMAGGKLAALKGAVVGLIDDLSVQVPADQLKLAMVPFSAFVNVGPGYAPSFNKKGKIVNKTGAWWLDLEGKTVIPQTELTEGVSRFELYRNLGQTWPGCVETRVPTKKAALDVMDIEPSAKNPETLFVPTFGIDEGDNPALYSNSYITSSVDPLDLTALGKQKKLKKYGVPIDAAGLIDPLLPLLPVQTNGKITETHGPNAGCDSQPIDPLSGDLATLKKEVKDLKASGTTNILEGVMWGWRVLSSREPFSQGQPVSNRTQKIMIVLTDGVNNMGVKSNPLGSTYSSSGYLVDGRLGVTTASSSKVTDLMNANTLAACNNAKSDGVEIYTIRLEEPDVATGTLLKECASGDDHYLDVPSRSQLDDAFKTIRTRMLIMRLAS